ncbi:MAG: hypothetical protein ABJK28_01480 [Algibacter sp.]
MKTKLKLLFLLPFFALLLFSSCQEEKVEITDPVEAETLVAESTLTTLISSASKMDGSKDNIIDEASCLSVELPVTVIIRGLEIIIDSEEDLKVIEALYDEFEDDEDTLDIVFPITIVLSDYEELVIDNRQALNELIADCKGENEEDDDIECIDFKYPISFSIYNPNFQVIDVVSIESDRELHRFIKRVRNAEVFASLNFPVTMIHADGTETIVNNNEDLESTIDAAKDACDEDDDNDYGDDDFTKVRLDELLMACPWDLYQFIRDGEDLSIEYRNYKMLFKENGVVNILTPGNEIHETGTWNTRLTDDGVLLSTMFNDNAGFDFEWTVYELQAGKIKLFKSVNKRLILKKNCDVDIDITRERIQSYLQECLWRISRISVDGAENDQDYIGTPLKFYENNVVKLRVNGELVEGTYEIGTRNTGFILQITLEGRPNLKLEWLITFLEQDLIKLENANNKMILERYCVGGDDDLNEIEAILLNKTWRITSYEDENVDKTAQFENWAFGFNESGKAFAEGEGRNVYGSWLAFRTEGLFLGLKYEDDTLLNILNYRWKIVEITENMIKLKDYNANGGIERILIFEKW